MLAAWLAFLGYAAAAIGVGWAASRRRETAAEYWTAGRDLGSVSVGLSISAGFLSVSWSCVYAVQLYYWYGLGAIWLITVPWLVALAGIYLLARRYHALPAFSQPEIVGQRFGRGSRRAVAAALAFVFLVWGGAEIYVAANLLAPAMRVSLATMIWMIGAVVGVYATLGGFRAVVDTDKLQYAIVVLYLSAMVALSALGLSAAGAAAAGGDMAASTGSRAAGAMASSGGLWGAFTALLPSPELEGAVSGTSWTDLMAPGLSVILLTFVAYLPGWIFETDLWLRVQGARDDRAARRGVVLAGLNALLFVGLVPMAIGVAALEIYPASDGSFPAAVGHEGDAIFAALVSDYAPAWLAGLLALGLVAAAMSTIDTCTNVMALSVAYDLLEVHRRSGSEGRSRLVTAASILAACLFALGTESLWDIFYLSSGVLTTAVAFPVAAVFLERPRSLAVTTSSVAGFAGTAVAYFLQAGGLLAPIQPLWLTGSGLAYIVWGLAAAAAGGLTGQFLSRS